MKKMNLIQLTLVSILAISMFAFSCSSDNNSPVDPPNDDDDDENPPVTEVKDIDGNLYNTVTIGTQVWMVENLRTTKLNDGTPLLYVTDNAQWARLDTAAYCWYDNDVSIGNTDYGALYNGYAVKSEKLCPAGWHVPSTADWNQLVDFLGGQLVAGGKMKETGTGNWLSPNTGATNESGFKALPGGHRIANTGRYMYFNQSGEWWLSSGTLNNMYLRQIDYDKASVSYYAAPPRNGLSVRCLKDPE